MRQLHLSRTDKKIFGVCGGIGAYKAVEVVRGLQKRGHDVVAIMTANATRFVGPVTFEAITHRRVITDQFEPGANADIGVPGFPGTGTSYGGLENAVMEITTYLDLKSGAYVFGFNSDDGFIAVFGPDVHDTLGTLLGFDNRGKGNQRPSRLSCCVKAEQREKPRPPEKAERGKDLLPYQVQTQLGLTSLRCFKYLQVTVVYVILQAPQSEECTGDKKRRQRVGTFVPLEEQIRRK